MKKILIATSIALLASVVLGGVAFADLTVNQANTTSTNSSMMLTCVATAVAKREAAIQSAFSTFSSSMTAAFQTRSTALAAAWAMTDKTARNSAIKAAWSTFNESAKMAKRTYNTDRLSTWNQFSTDRKTCHAPATGESASADSIM
jgi:predicted negative regulator of RcsB-dependent stress response